MKFLSIRESLSRGFSFYINLHHKGIYIMDYSIDQLLEIATSVIAIASVIVASTDTPERKGFYGKFYCFLEVLALVVWRAKQQPKNDKIQRDK